MLHSPGKAFSSRVASSVSQRARLQQQAMQGTASCCSCMMAVCILLCLRDRMWLECIYLALAASTELLLNNLLMDKVLCRSKASTNNKKNKKDRKEEIKARQHKAADTSKPRCMSPCFRVCQRL